MFTPLASKPSPTLRPESSAISTLDWAVLADFWYPVGVAQALTDSPARAKLLDVDLVLFRGAGGKVAVNSDICPHRHVRLSGGKVIDGEIECPFHGLRFDVDGRCQRVPALGRAAKLPDSYRLRSFPAEERYGLIWTCLGDPSKHGVPDFPVLNDSDPSHLAIIDGAWPISAPRQVENFTDLAHLPFIHASTLGGDPAAAIKPAKIEYGLGELTAVATYVETGADGQPSPHILTYRIVLPFCIQFRSQEAAVADHFFDGCDLASPVSAHASRVFQIIKSPQGRDAARAMAPMLIKVNEQDIAVLETLMIPDLPLDMQREIHLPVDNIAHAYRGRLRELGLGAGPGPARPEP